MEMLSLGGKNDLTSLCRICLGHPDEKELLDMNLIYDEDEQINYFVCFEICTNIKMKEEIGFPKNLCKSCGVELQLVYDFHKKIQESQRLLNEWLEERNTSSHTSSNEECTTLSTINIKDEEIIHIEALPKIEAETNPEILEEIDYNFNNGFEVINDDIPLEIEKSNNLEEEHLDFEIFHPSEIIINEATMDSDENASSSPFLSHISGEDLDLKTNLENFEKILVEDEDLCSIIDTGIVGSKVIDYHDFGLIDIDIDNDQEEFIDIRTNIGGEVANKKVRKRFVGKSICEICKKEFKNHSRMLLHQKCHETNRLNYSCDECGRVYVTKQAMQAHIRTVHSKTGHTCNICHKIYPIKKCLEIHMRFHTGDFPYECDICKKRFAQICHLKTHKNVKHNNVRFGCQYPKCGKYFTSSASLRNHEFSHSIMPFECLFCQKGYPAKAKLKAHIKRTHKTEMTLEELEPMRKFQVLRSKLNMVQIIDTEE